MMPESRMRSKDRLCYHQLLARIPVSLLVACAAMFPSPEPSPVEREGWERGNTTRGAIDGAQYLAAPRYRSGIVPLPLPPAEG